MILHLSEKASSPHLSEKRRSLRASQGCLGCLMSLHLSEKNNILRASRGSPYKAARSVCRKSVAVLGHAQVPRFYCGA
jgi:hypothetical protein